MVMMFMYYIYIYINKYTVYIYNIGSQDKNHFVVPTRCSWAVGPRNDPLFQGKDPLAWKLTIKTYQHGGLNRTHDEQRD